MEFKINPNNVAEETTSDYNRFEQNDFLITSASDNLFNNPGQSKDKNNVVTHNQYGMRWYLFMVWGVLIYYRLVMGQQLRVRAKRARRKARNKRIAERLLANKKK